MLPSRRADDGKKKKKEKKRDPPVSPNVWTRHLKFRSCYGQSNKKSTEGSGLGKKKKPKKKKGVATATSRPGLSPSKSCVFEVETEFGIILHPCRLWKGCC